MTEEQTSENSTPSPAEMLAITEQQQQRAERALDVSPGLLFGVWGAAWCLGFGELYLTIGDDPVLAVSLWYALGIFFGCLGVAGVITVWHLASSLRGLRGPSQKSGAMHGWSWMLGFVALGAMIAATSRLGIPEDVYAMLWTSGSGLLVGVLYLSGGALTGSWTQYGVGLWILAINAAGAFTGIPNHYLVMSLAGGGGFLVAGTVLTLRDRAGARPSPSHERLPGEPE
ncbi:hypothetical protein SAMN04487905_102228 [Actinopolyspora xinjiangensis]|uniref:Uncharacterized protein n=1 Tax=Actinopolyspora xinjiangensis TaxID=405564 RepID=A0A1H0QGK9_9ACTN|nr:hypothetical protein [Actinopolyspora xinjiangensis]SDP16467.1 hypothetical protein SAMN04487905_102228 [Actinopolyspora xinjiangensis]